MAYAFDREFEDVISMLSTIVPHDVHASRALLASMVPAINAGVDVSGLSIEDRHIPGPPNAADVAVRTYRRAESATAAAVLYLHGGGFVSGSVDSEHGQAAAIARHVGATVVSVEYRLAPEHPFPAGLEDCYAAYTWLCGHAASLGVDTARIAVVGMSAGGGLAAGLTLLMRDRGAPQLAFQYLGIPELDDRLHTVSMTTFVDTPLFNRPAAESSWRHYLGDQLGETSPYAAPARAADLSGLPPAYISTMEFDPLRDEGILYGLALLQAGVSCELHSFPGTFHGSSMVATAEVSRRIADELIAVLTRRLS